MFFDNLSVKTYSGPLVEEDHYYPYGLTMSGISDKALKTNYVENKNRYNDGGELQNKEFSDGSGLESYDAENRMYDPQVGRFWQMDALAEINENWSPYSFAYDNPILFNDPIGLIGDSSHPQNLKEVIVTPGQNTGVHLASVGATGPAPITGSPISSAPTSALAGGALAVGASAGAETIPTLAETVGVLAEVAPPVAFGTFVVGSIYVIATTHSNYSPPYNPVGDISIGIPKPHIPPNLVLNTYPRVPSVFPYPGSDPTKAPPGFIWKGQPGSVAGDAKGSFTNPETGEALRPDVHHDVPIGPHWDYKDKEGDWHRLYPDGTSQQKKDR